MSFASTPLSALKGVGEKRLAQLARLGITDLPGLLRHYPRHYEDWSSPCMLRETVPGEPCCVRATLLNSPQTHRIRKGLTLYKCTAHDGQDGVQITLFNNPYLAQKLRRDETYYFYGVVTGPHPYAMASPQVEPAGRSPRIRPLYPLTEGLSSRMVEGVVQQALTLLEQSRSPDPLPETLRETYGLCDRLFAFQNIHFPADHAALAQARRRLVFEELLCLQLGMLRLRLRSRASTAPVLHIDHTAAFEQLLPFSLTGAQKRAIAAAIADMRDCKPMNRLLQGEVGSGKTAVAAGLAFSAVKNGWQAALMAPTEILAEQHFRSLSALLTPAGVTVGLLTGSMTAAQKKAVRESLAAGKIGLLVGTHALISRGVEFARLGLVITDEQHRFGVGQRAALSDKGQDPHRLVMSATPIPRTLALILYGDLDVSVLDELPPGRQPIATFAVGSDKRERAYNYVKKHLDAGKQGYLVCPLVEEGETEAASATQLFEKLAAGSFKNYRLGLLHGRMKGAEKDAVMTAFARGDLDLLISTTVIEVGVDVPNAVIMVIENAERFGLAQLHQLRGRVGRGKDASTCILVSDAQNDEAKRRLRVMCDTTDGFRIAEEDLKLRGPGDFFGSRQHGLPQLQIADFASDMALCEQAQLAARRILADDPNLTEPQNRGLAAMVERLYATVGDGGLN